MKVKNHFNWTYKNIADITGNTPESVKAVLNSKTFPRWAKLSVIIYEKMTEENNLKTEEISQEELVSIYRAFQKVLLGAGIMTADEYKVFRKTMTTIGDEIRRRKKEENWDYSIV